MGLKLLLTVVLDPHYFFLYLKLIFIFIILTFNGLVIFSYIFKSRNQQAVSRFTRNKYLNLGGGMIAGPLVFLLILSIFSYILKGPIAITILFIIYTIICYLLFKIRKISFQNLIKVKKSLNNIVVFGVTIFYLLFIFLNSGNAAIGGDSSTYWGIATSFARGNYPTVLPWQPNFLTVYHEGAFIVEGAIYAISGMGISIVHTFFSAYMITAVFLFVTGMAREKVRSILCFTPAIFGLILFGGPIIYSFKSGFSFLPIINIFDKHPMEISDNFNLFSQFADFKKSIGSGASSLDGLVYANFHAFAIATFFLFLFLLIKLPKNKLFKNILLIILMSLTLSIEETVFLIEVGIFIPYLLIFSKKSSLKVTIKQVLFLFLIFILLFFLIQNPIRDSYFTKGNMEPRFELLSIHDLAFRDRVSFMQGLLINPKNLPNYWYIPDLRLSLILFLTLSIWKKSRISMILIVSSSISLVLSLLIVNTFWNPNGFRFTNLSNELLMYAVGFLILDLVMNRKKLFFFIILLALIFSLVPQALFANIHFVKDAFTNKLKNFTTGINTKNTISDWISEHMQYDKKFLFIDDYRDSAKYSPMTWTAAQNYGIFTPTVYPGVKVVSFEFGGEWYDAEVSLSPRSLKILNIDYVFIKYPQDRRFSQRRRSQLADTNYFTPVYKDKEGVLYKVEPQFKTLEDEEVTLNSIEDKVPDGKIVYLDTFEYVEIRKGLLLNLANRTKLIGPRYNGGYDYFMYIETFLPLIPTDTSVKIPELEKVDYLITRPGVKPNSLVEGNFEKVVETLDISLWRKIY